MDDKKATRLSIETLLEVVEDSENMEICIVKDNKQEMMDFDSLDEIVKQIKKEKEEAEDAKKKKD